MKRVIPVAVLLVLALAGGFWYVRRAPNLNSATKHLYQALQDNDVQAVSDALAQGADVNGRNELGFTPLIWSVYAGKSPALASVVPLLLDRGANINTPGIGNETALIVAVKGKKMDAVQALLARKADTGVKNVEGKTALAIARKYRLTQIAAQLEATGATQ